MGREILMATVNPHKTERFKHYLSECGLSVVNFTDVGRNIDVVEDGKTPEENALKKAIAGFNATKLPAFGVDYWFYIEGLPDEIQPGPHVRRIFIGKGGERKEATDEEMLDYYTGLIDKLGGRANGLWMSAIALVVAPEKVFTERFTSETLLIAQRSPKVTVGEPLNSIQIDPKSGKYFTDLTKGEWLRLQKEREGGYVRFFESHLNEL